MRKIADRMLEKRGFTKVSETLSGVEYVREEEGYTKAIFISKVGYCDEEAMIECVALLNKRPAVGLLESEMRICLRKIKELHW